MSSFGSKCKHGELETYAPLVNAIVNNAVLLQLTHTLDATSNHSHPALFFW